MTSSPTWDNTRGADNKRTTEDDSSGRRDRKDEVLWCYGKEVATPICGRGPPLNASPRQEREVLKVKRRIDEHAICVVTKEVMDGLGCLQLRYVRTRPCARCEDIPVPQRVEGVDIKAM
jgi:hypothetical protein